MNHCENCRGSIVVDTILSTKDQSQPFVKRNCFNEIVAAPLFADVSRNLSLSSTNLDQKRTRLSTLPQARLLDLLIQASSIHPDLAIFPASISMKTEESIAPAEATASAGGLDIDGEADATAEPYDGYDTDPPAHYPKAGNGVARTLRPEAEDLQWLVDENTEVFSHETNYLDSSGTNGNGNGVGGAGDVSMGGI